MSQIPVRTCSRYVVKPTTGRSGDRKRGAAGRSGDRKRGAAGRSGDRKRGAAGRGGSPPLDGGSPPLDGGSPPLDGGSPPLDGGSPPPSGLEAFKATDPLPVGDRGVESRQLHPRVVQVMGDDVVAECLPRQRRSLERRRRFGQGGG